MQKHIKYRALEDKNMTFELNGFTPEQVKEVSEAEYIKIEQHVFIRKDHAAKIMGDWARKEYGEERASKCTLPDVVFSDKGAEVCDHISKAYFNGEQWCCGKCNTPLADCSQT